MNKQSFINNNNKQNEIIELAPDITVTLKDLEAWTKRKQQKQKKEELHEKWQKCR